MSVPNGYDEATAMLMVFCAEHHIAADVELVRAWVVDFWDRRYEELRREAELAGGVTLGQNRASGGVIVCSPNDRCGDVAKCIICAAN